VRATDSHPDLPGYVAIPEHAWLAGWLICVVILIALPAWQVAPLDAAWISLAVLYGLRVRPSPRLLALTAMAVAVTVAALGEDWIRHLRVVGGSVSQIPLLAAIVVVMAWQANRWVVADDRAAAGELDRLRALDDQLLLILAAADADLPSSRRMLNELSATLTTSIRQLPSRKGGPA